jgi:hypothetical protein
MGTCGFIRLYVLAISKHGFAEVIKHQSVFDFTFLIFAGFLISVPNWRVSWRYYSIAVVLGGMVFNGWRLVIKQWMALPSHADVYLRSEGLDYLIGCVLLSWLFYRFTFGRPSRTYFRVIREQP